MAVFCHLIRQFSRLPADCFIRKSHLMAFNFCENLWKVAFALKSGRPSDRFTTGKKRPKVDVMALISESGIDVDLKQIPPLQKLSNEGYQAEFVAPKYIVSE